jgi:hypothetical protein
MFARLETDPVARWAGLGLLVLIGLIHLFEAPDQFGDATYKGVLFLLNATGCIVAGYGLIRRERWGWWLGALISLATGVGYVWSRSVGLPGLPRDTELFEPIGVVSVLAEVAFCGLTLALPLFTGTRRREPERIRTAAYRNGTGA